MKNCWKRHLCKVWDKIPTLEYIIVLNNITYQSEYRNISWICRNHVSWASNLKSKILGRQKERWQSLTQDDLASILFLLPAPPAIKQRCPLTHKNILSSTLAVSQVAYFGGLTLRYEEVSFSRPKALSHNWNRIRLAIAPPYRWGNDWLCSKAPKPSWRPGRKIQPSFLMLVSRLWERINGINLDLCTTSLEGKAKWIKNNIGRKVLEKDWWKWCSWPITDWSYHLFGYCPERGVFAGRSGSISDLS